MLKRTTQLTADPDKNRAWKQRSKPLRQKSAIARSLPSRGSRTPNTPNGAPIASQGQRKPRKPIKQYRPAIKGTVKDLERQLDDLTRCVLRSDEGVCFTDGRRGMKDDPLELSHLFGRSLRPSRFDVHREGNCHLQHRSCNSRHNDDKSTYRDKFIARFGQEAYDDLDARAHSGSVFDYIHLVGMIEQREAMLR